MWDTAELTWTLPKVQQGPLSSLVNTFVWLKFHKLQNGKSFVELFDLIPPKAAKHDNCHHQKCAEELNDVNTNPHMNMDMCALWAGRFKAESRPVLSGNTITRGQLVCNSAVQRNLVPHEVFECQTRTHQVMIELLTQECSPLVTLALSQSTQVGSLQQKITGISHEPDATKVCNLELLRKTQKHQNVKNTVSSLQHQTQDTMTKCRHQK